jgi:hypothetical protein
MQHEIETLHQRPADYLQISPVTVSGDGGKPEVCEIGHEDGFALFGMTKGGDEFTAYEALQIEEVVRVALLAHRAFGYAVRWHDAECLTTRPVEDFADMAEDMAASLHVFVYDELDEADHADLELRGEAFEAHPLSAVRDAFCDYSDYNGAGTCRDPRLPIEVQ